MSHRANSTNFHWLSPHDWIFLILLKAIKQSNWTRAQGARTPFEHRAMIFRNAADMIAGKYNTGDIIILSVCFFRDLFLLTPLLLLQGQAARRHYAGHGQDCVAGGDDSDVETVGWGG